MTKRERRDGEVSRSIRRSGSRVRDFVRSAIVGFVLTVVGAVALAARATPTRADGALETETARVLEQSRWQVGLAAEIQLAGEGREVAVPAVVEVGLWRRFELQVEPVFYTGIYPKSGSNATGAGDTELTLTYLAFEETCGWPAFAFAAEAKLPTANDRRIGTGRADFAGYVIASRQWREFDFHANLGYTVVGQGSGEGLDNVFNFAIAAEYRFCEKIDFVAELLATTSAGGGDSSMTPEASGGELVGSAGVRYHFSEEWSGYFVVSYDNSNAVGIRIGVTWEF